MKNYPRILLVALVILLVLPASHLFASSIAVPAIGGNFSGPVEDNVAAIFWNPAALGQLEGRNVFTTINTSFLNFTYKSDTDPWTGEDKNYPEVKSSSFSPPPFLGFASDYGPEKLVWGVAFYVPFGGSLDWPDEVTVDGATEPAPQRFQMIKTDIKCLTFGPAAAYKVLDNLMFGAGVSFNYGMLDSELISKEEAELEGVVIPEGYIEARATEEGLTGIAVGWSFGALWKPLEYLDIGASYISGLNFTLKGDIKIEVEPHDMLLSDGTTQFLDLTLAGKGDIELKPFKLPQMINLGAEYRPTDKIELDLALRWEGWSVRKYSNAKIDVPIEGDLGGVPVSDEISKTHRMDWDLENVLGLRVWGMYRLLEKLKLGAGFGWEQGAGSPDYTSVENYSTDRIRLFGGGQYEADFWIFENLVLELSYLHAFYGDLTVKDESKKDPPVVGSFGGKLDFISFGAAYKF